jgi:hypothetical protein
MGFATDGEEARVAEVDAGIGVAQPVSNATFPYCPELLRVETV